MRREIRAPFANAADVAHRLIAVDFGSAPINATREIFSPPRIVGPYFHLGQALWRRVQTIGIQWEYESGAPSTWGSRFYPHFPYVDQMIYRACPKKSRLSSRETRQSRHGNSSARASAIWYGGFGGAPSCEIDIWGVGRLGGGVVVWRTNNAAETFRRASSSGLAEGDRSCLQVRRDPLETTEHNRQGHRRSGHGCGGRHRVAEWSRGLFAQLHSRACIEADATH